MPNWRNAAAYEFSSDFPDDRWAWEFLRRNPDYKRDWIEVLSRFKACEGEFVSKKDPSYWNSNPPTETQERRVFIDPDEDPSNPWFYIPVDAAYEKWGLGGYLNPDQDSPKFLLFSLSYGTVLTGPQTKAPQRSSPGGVWVEFNLALPLKPQLSHIGAFLRSLQQPTWTPQDVRHHRRLWLLYLRLLDAELEGWNPKQIADNLERDRSGRDEALDEKKIWDRLQSAKRMTRPEGYLSIVRTSLRVESEPRRSDRSGSS